MGTGENRVVLVGIWHVEMGSLLVAPISRNDKVGMR